MDQPVTIRSALDRGYDADAMPTLAAWMLLACVWHRRTLTARLVPIGMWVAFDVLHQAKFGLAEAVAKLGLLTVLTAAFLTMSLLGEAHGLTRRYSKSWVKFLDFPYLGLAFVGVVRILNSSGKTQGKIDDFDEIGLVLLAVALGVRLAKATLEVFFERHLTPSS